VGDINVCLALLRYSGFSVDEVAGGDEQPVGRKGSATLTGHSNFNILPLTARATQIARLSIRIQSLDGKKIESFSMSQKTLQPASKNYSKKITS
jgi:hypothetical protein